MTMDTQIKTLPALNRPDEDQISDEILLDTALADHKAVGKVKGRRSRNQATDARAWTSSGNVD